MGFPRRPDDLDCTWLSGALGAEVIELAAEPIGVGVGLLGDLRRVTLRYADGASGPASVVVKWATTEPESRLLADGLGYYAREVQWYAHHAVDCPLPGPRCFHSEQADDTTDFVLVLEDLTDHQIVDQLVGLDADQAATAVEAAADLHAHFWGRADLADLAAVYLPINNEIYPLVLPDLFARAWRQTVKHAPDVVAHPDIRGFGDRYHELLTWFLERLHSPTTMVHGDLRADNLFFTAGGGVTVVDYQIAGQSFGAYDPAYLMSQSVPVDVRRRHEHEILDRYHARLIEGGIDDYSREQLWDDYRVALAFCLIYPVSAYDRLDELGNERGRRLVDTMLERSVNAIVDTDALALVP